ncbi:MAG: hypothetical protein AAGF49_01290, partial [Pseudomonadota bacterium]
MDTIDASEGWSTFTAWLAVQGVNILFALVVLVVGWFAIKFFRRWFRAWIERTDHMDPIVEHFLASLLHYGLLAVLLIAVLSLMGVQT